MPWSSSTSPATDVAPLRNGKKEAAKTMSPSVANITLLESGVAVAAEEDIVLRL